MPNRLNIRFYPGRRWSETLIYKNADTGEVIDLTGYTAEMRIGDELTLDETDGITIDGPNGSVTIVVSAVRTNALVAASGVFELDVVSQPGIPVGNEPVQGSYTVEPRPAG
jgi:hypothetical protein